MSWLNAKTIAEKSATTLPNILAGCLLQIVDFEDDETCRFYFRDRDLGFHRMINRAFARIVRKRGGKILHVTLSLRDYENDVRVSELLNEPALTPLEFARKCYRIFSSSEELLDTRA